jgi:GNAT superfamily N-acetyltransferase
MTDLRMRLAHADDAPAIARLARRVARRWIMPGQPPVAALALDDALSARVIRAKIQVGQRFHLAFVGDALAGIAAVRNDNHVFQFFVGTRHQGRGIGRRLWNRLRADAIRRAGTRVFTLNAAAGAVPIYLRLGFLHNRHAPPPQGKIIAVPMIYRVADAVKRARPR